MGGPEGRQWLDRLGLSAHLRALPAQLPARRVEMDVAKDLHPAALAGEGDGGLPAREAIAAGIRTANEAILAEARGRGKQMGSTIVVLLVPEQRFAVLWVGDSRAYVLRDGELIQLSRDHTQVQEMVERGILSAEDAVNHPMGHILSRAVGVQEEVKVDRVDGRVVPGDIFLLCSDGLHGYVEEREIRQLLARGSPEKASEDLVERTLANGAPDNVTVIAVWASEPTLLSLPDR